MQAGPRLKAFLEGHWGRHKGGMTALADAAGVRRQTLYEWFNPSSPVEPSLKALGDVANAIGMRRVDLIAAMDGVIAPEQQETPRPEWAEGLEERIVAMIESRVIGDASVLEPVIRRVAARLGLPPLPLDEGPPEEGEAPPGIAHTARRRSA